MRKSHCDEVKETLPKWEVLEGSGGFLPWPLFMLLGFVICYMFVCTKHRNNPCFLCKIYYLIPMGVQGRQLCQVLILLILLRLFITKTVILHNQKI